MKGPPPLVIKDLIRKALGKMKCGKTADLSGINDKMLKAAGKIGIELLTDGGFFFFFLLLKFLEIFQSSRG